ncbi:helix-turn-helix transcriptional regulator [Actinomadura rudentiformis]|uniref:AAA family ATPase n=1 Tax=Actinomadura rudentiformis TaxID=359158 RepID=A0A6H9Z0M7_9ACTN|nr:LuxR family transcriptional regulator [Actinomadura rudentiformis]KAB2346536.1 AAA family ATPase [Actinomadura rudentiformis]
MLVGREPEQEHITGLLTEARAGRSAALAIYGEAGIGKSTLVEFAVAAARDMTVMRGLGIESEAEIPFGALFSLLHPYLHHIEALPGPQAAALRGAFGLADTGASDRFLIGAATLTLLAEIAGERPVLCVVDDAQWLDRASSDALQFAARRLGADPIAMIFALRDEGERSPVQGIAGLRVTALSDADADRLLNARSPGLAAPVAKRVLAEAAGNPLAIIELGDGSATPVGPLPVAGRVQEAFRARLAALPAATRSVLAVAAADETAGLNVVLRAAARIGAGAADLDAAEQAGLVSFAGDEVRFRHPLVRSVAYQSTSHHQRIAVHAALAAELPGEQHADRRAWHRAAAATGPDEEVAAELERAARRAQDRGGPMAVAAAYERAARLSTDSEGRARRIVNAARAAYDAGRPAWAARLAAEGAASTEDSRLAAEATFIRAQVEYEATSPAADAALALEAAELITGEAAASMLTEAVFTARDAGAHDLMLRAAGHLEKLELPDGSPLVFVVEGLIGWARLLHGEPEPAVPAMRALVGTAFDGYLERLCAAFTGLLIADDDVAGTLVDSIAADARADGALTWLTYILEVVALGNIVRGEFRDAESAVAEGASLAADIGMDVQKAIFDAMAVCLAGIFGDEERCASPDGAAFHPPVTALAHWGRGLLHLAAGRADEALERLDTVCRGPARYDVLIRAVPDHVEAAVRAGRLELGREHLPAFDRWAEQTGREPVLALSRRCRALLSSDDAAEEHFVAALRLSDGSRPYDEARTRLVYGEWLRRRRRRTEAASELAQARDTFDRLGATPWAARARAELGVLGGPSTSSAAAPHNRLTPQELQVVRLAAAGHSNREIAAQLFLSPRTIGHHLYRSYRKLGISKRIELTQLQL